METGNVRFLGVITKFEFINNLTSVYFKIFNFQVYAHKA